LIFARNASILPSSPLRDQNGESAVPTTFTRRMPSGQEGYNPRTLRHATARQLWRNPTPSIFSKTEEAARTINAWVEKQTQEKIQGWSRPTPSAPRPASSSPRRLLQSALVLPSGSQDLQRSVSVAADRKAEVPFMNQTEAFGYFKPTSSRCWRCPTAAANCGCSFSSPARDGRPSSRKSCPGPPRRMVVPSGGWIVELALPSSLHGPVRTRRDARGDGHAAGLLRTGGFSGISDETISSVA
jgi:hypothetical protein